jgi:hypothetical protein
MQRWWLWLLCGCALLGAAGAGAPDAPLLKLSQAELHRPGLAELHQPGLAAQPVTLPYREYRAGRALLPYRMVFRFDAPAALVHTRSTLALDSWPDGGQIALNGVEVADIASSTEAQVTRYLRPFAFNLPPGALRERGNQLVFEWRSRGTLVLLPQPLIGPREALEPLVERKVFWEHTVVQASTVFAWVIGLVMLAVGWQQRRAGPIHQIAGGHALLPDGDTEREYLLIGSTALGWVLYNTMFMWSPLPADWFVWRRIFGFLGIGVFALGMWISLARLAGWRSPAFEALCWLCAAAAPCNWCWATGSPGTPTCRCPRACGPWLAQCWAWCRWWWWCVRRGANAAPVCCCCWFL